MKPVDLRELQALISAMSAGEIAAITKAVEKREGQVEGSVVMEERAASITVCPHCGHKAVKWGSKNSVPRFKCKNPAIQPSGKLLCGKTFNVLTGTPLAHLHNTDKFIANARCMINGLSVRKTAAQLDFHKDTAFSWRHRFLQCIKQEQPLSLSGLVEADETFFLESFKGKRGGLAVLGRKPKSRGTPAEKRGLSDEQIPVLVARDRSMGMTLTTVLPSRTAKSIEGPLMPRLAKDAELFTDGAAAYRKIAKKHGIELRIVPVNKKHKTVGVLHINNVNAYDQRLKGWMDRFRGVATCYLENYLGWHRWLDSKGKSGARKFLASAMV